MKLSILGCYAATPRSDTNPTSQVLECRNQLFLIDCGEGTQVQLRRNKIKFSRIDHIFISHLHGDHFFGLPGLLATFRLLGREKEIHVYGPKGLKEAISLMLQIGETEVGYPIRFHELNKGEPVRIYENDKVTVDTIPLSHRIYTNGFLFREKPKDLGLNVDAAKKYGIDTSQYRNIKKGKDILLADGTLISNSELTFPPQKVKSYAYCCDTAFESKIVPIIAGSDVLYHDTTFLENEKHLAKKTGHSTAKEAAKIAREAEVGQLILGHFSTRYTTTDQFLEEALTEFPNTSLAKDGKVFEW
ncbi:MAG: ribonuclease Z [Eudoraea sp.]|nr:ribonuclease Z [Eudoraea sp.]